MSPSALARVTEPISYNPQAIEWYRL